MWTTLKRDLMAIAIKTRHVILPNGKGGARLFRFFFSFVSMKTRSRGFSGTLALRDWDLWGPLLMSFLLAIIVGVSVENTPQADTRKSLSFAVVFVVVALGSLIVTFNAKVLGGQVSIFQSVCVLGYCMFPLVVVALVIAVVRAATSWHNILFRGLLVLGAFFWSSWASVGFMGALVARPRKLLSVYPVVLFYLILAWIILSLV